MLVNFHRDYVIWAIHMTAIVPRTRYWRFFKTVFICLHLPSPARNYWPIFSKFSFYIPFCNCLNNFVGQKNPIILAHLWFSISFFNYIYKDKGVLAGYSTFSHVYFTLALMDLSFWSKYAQILLFAETIGFKRTHCCVRLASLASACLLLCAMCLAWTSVKQTDKARWLFKHFKMFPNKIVSIPDQKYII